MTRYHVELNSLGDETCRPGYRATLLDYLRAHRDELRDEHKDHFEENPLRSDLAVRRLQGIRFGREGGRHGLEPYLTLTDDAAAREEDVQALHRRRVPRSESGRSLEWTARTSRARREKTPRRRPRGSSRVPGLVRPDRLQPRPGPLPPRRDDGSSSRRSRRVCAGAAEVEDAIDRIVWYAGWADKLPQVLGGANPVAGPYFNFTVPEPTGVVGSSLPPSRRSAASSPGSRRRSSAGTPSSPSPRRSIRWRRSSSPRRWRHPTSREER